MRREEGGGRRGEDGRMEGRRWENGGKMEDDGGSYRLQLIRGFALTVFHAITSIWGMVPDGAARDTAWARHTILMTG